MTAKEHSKRVILHRLWATGQATKKQILECMALDRKQEAAVAKARNAKGDKP